MKTIQNYKVGKPRDFTSNSISFLGDYDESQPIDDKLLLDLIRGYNYLLPNNFNVFKNFKNIENVKSENAKHHAIIFLSKFQEILLKVKSKSNFTGSLPPLKIIPDDDGSVLIEWIFKDLRLGFSFEENHSNSSWYIVSNEKFGNIDFSISFDNKNNDTYLEEIIFNIIENH